MNWQLQVLGLELRKSISYRFDFWIQLVGAVIVQLCVAYFLWDSIFETKQVNHVGGYSFESLMWYYVFALFSEKLTHGPLETDTPKEIYDGTFTKYLLYPINVVAYKFLSYLGVGATAFVQLCVALIVSICLKNSPEFSFINLLMFFSLLIFGIYLMFIMMLCLEMLSFWVDNVWSLLVMLRLTVQLLGGILLPIQMFPDNVQAINRYLPFQFASGLPVQTLLGKVPVDQFLEYCVLGVFWSCALTLLSYFILRKGLARYSGVGI